MASRLDSHLRKASAVRQRILVKITGFDTVREQDIWCDGWEAVPNVYYVGVDDFPAVDGLVVQEENDDCQLLLFQLTTSKVTAHNPKPLNNKPNGERLSFVEKLRDIMVARQKARVARGAAVAVVAAAERTGVRMRGRGREGVDEEDGGEEAKGDGQAHLTRMMVDGELKAAKRHATGQQVAPPPKQRKTPKQRQPALPPNVYYFHVGATEESVQRPRVLKWVRLVVFNGPFGPAVDYVLEKQKNIEDSKK